jgi:hypothetical protein
MTKQELKKKYDELLHKVATEDFFKGDLSKRVNCYKCLSCGHTTKTKDVAIGVTPFIFECEVCGGDAHSTFYRDIVPSRKPTIEWYRPTFDELLQLPKHSYEHILQGGLWDRKIKRVKTGAALIVEERREQVKKHGYLISVDVRHNGHGQLLSAAERLIRPVVDPKPPYDWSQSIWDNIASKGYKDRLVIAGALIAAEIDRQTAIENRELKTDDLEGPDL